MEIAKMSLIDIADKVLLHFNDYGKTYENDAFIDAGFPKEEIEEAQHARTIVKVIQLLEYDFEYIEHTGPGSDLYQLTEKGRQVKADGGHVAHIEKLKEKAIADAKRQKRKDKSDELDLKIKQWTYKARRVPYYFSTLALIGTIISITLSIKASKSKTSPQDLESLKQTIQQLQERMNRLDSLFQADTLLKKRK